jgi:hypothetical protein
MTEFFVVTTCHLWHIKSMKLDDLLVSVAKQSFFETGFLLAGAVAHANVIIRVCIN